MLNTYIQLQHYTDPIEFLLNMSFFLATKETKPWPNRVLVCSFLSDGKKRKKISSSLLPIITILYCTSSNLVDKLQNSARLLRQTAKLSPVAWVTSMPCPALCRLRASTFQNKSFTELLLFKVKAQVWNKILFVKKISL